MSDKRAALQRQIEQAKARLAKMDAADKVADRKARTRKSIVLGEAVLAALSNGETVQISGDAAGWLDTRLKRPQDRTAWGLLTAPSEPEQPQG